MLEGFVLVGIGGVTTIALLLFAVRQVRPVIPFLYSNARIQARSKYLLSDDQLYSLAECHSLPELSSSLRETEYAERLEKATSVREYHLAFEKSFIAAAEELKEMSPESVWPLFDAYLMFWEAKMLKTFYRALLTGQKLEDLVFPIGRINPTVLEHLKEAETLADLKVIVSDTPYQEVFEGEYETLEEFEAALDNLVFHYFVEKVRETKVYEGDLVIDLLNFKFDIQNLLVLLKLETRKVPKEECKKYLIKNETPLFYLTEKLILAKNLKEFVDVCSHLHYYQPLSQAMEKYEEDGSLSHFERVLWRYFKKVLLKMERLHFQGPFPLFAYLLKRELEMRNLMIVSKGIDANLSPSEIKEMIV